MRSEVEAAIKKLKKRKAPGIDNISTEMIQAGGEVTIDIMYRICDMI